MERLTANLTSRPIRQTHQGREYLVAPATLLVPGVLNGNQGPLYYPDEEVQKAPWAWNDTPILVYHPQDSNDSGRSLKVLDHQGIGRVHNARYEDGSLKADLWFDVQRTQTVDPRIYDAVANAGQVELSTGLGTDNEEAEEGASFNGTEYKATARNYRPDHLAILPDQVGACSLRDGCGVNNALVGLQGALQSALTEKLGSNEPYITSVQPTYLVYQTSQGLFKLGYSSPDNVTTLSDAEPVAVEQKTIYATVNKDSLVGSSDSTLEKEGSNMTLTEAQKKETIDSLITNSCCWTEEDRSELEGMSDTTLQKTREVADHQTQNEELLTAAEQGFDETHTFNREKREWEQKEKKVEDTNNQQAVLSEEDQAVLNYGREAMQREKQELIDRITQNVSEDAKPATVATFGTKTIEELRQIAALMPAPTTENHYAGQPQNQTGDPEMDQEDRLEEPEMDWTANSVFAGQQS